MQSKKIIIKTLNKSLNSEFCKILSNYPKIKFFNKKINGEFVTTIKCHNYYNDLNPFKVKSEISQNIYGNYIYLYTNISLILSELIIDFFEKLLVSRLIDTYYFYFSNSEITKIKNISNIILDPNFPSDNSKKLYLYKKELILNRLLLNFRSKNHVTIEAFANFSLDNYYLFLEDVIEKATHIYFSNTNHFDLINFILNNLLKWDIVYLMLTWIYKGGNLSVLIWKNNC